MPDDQLLRLHATQRVLAEMERRVDRMIAALPWWQRTLLPIAIRIDRQLDRYRR